MNVKIEDWSITVWVNDPYMDPILNRAISGTIYGHPKQPDGKKITTSGIIDVYGNIVTTKSGTKYQLGKPSKSYLKWMQDNEYEYDPENPIKVISNE